MRFLTCWLFPLVTLIVASNCFSAETLIVEEPQLAGISGFRVMWDEYVPLAEDGAVAYTDSQIKDAHPTAVWAPAGRGDQPGAIAIDALQRSVLVRFPLAAEQIAGKISEGFAIRRVELVLPFRDHELWPPHGKDFCDPESGGYTARRNWGVDRMYRENPPNWHAVAWAVRRPWSTDNPELAPTFNAFIGRVGYWSRFGAQDESQDRFAQQFGPTEVSQYHRTGRMDVTAVLQDDTFGKSLGQRLRVLSDQGFIVKKWETYDHRYFNGVYEWATATGGRGILLRTPKLVVTFDRVDQPSAVSLPTATDISRLAAQLRTAHDGGQPSARLMTPSQLAQFNRQVMAQPEWMPDWQFQRVQELRALRGLDQKAPLELEEEMFFDIFLSNHVVKNLYGTRTRIDGKSVALPATAYERYKAWVDIILARQPRGWSGFEAGKAMAQWYTYGDALPGPAKDAIRTYWTAWLMPDRETAEFVHHRDNFYIDGPLVHPMADQLANKKGTSGYVQDTYWEKTGDRRGNKSFYRSGFNYTISTQNFNTTASAGALLGGAIIDAERPMRDGRHGFRNYPLGLWTWSNGSCQEHIDHYYFSITLCGNKAVYDFGPSAYDRMLGRSVITYDMEELTGAFHPELRRFIAPSSRTSLMHLLATTDGIQHVLHTLSPRGALFDFDKPQHLPAGMQLIGNEVPPEIVALQTTTKAWAPDWIAHMIDDKQLPFYATHSNGDHWRRCYMGQHYGIASIDLAMPRIQAMAQWRREKQTVDQISDLGTLDVRFGINGTKFAASNPGYLGRVGSTAVFQHKNKQLILSSPFLYWNGSTGVGVPGSGKAESITSLQTSIALFNYQQPEPSWKIFIDGRQVSSLPATARQGQVITIEDGVTYLGIIPLPATDLGRDAEVSVRAGTAETFGKIEIHPTLVIDSYNLRRDRPLEHGRDDFAAIDAAYGGFVLEMGDNTEFRDFAAFQRHMQACTVEQQFHTSTSVQEVVYRSGEDVLRASRPTVHDREARGEIPADEFIRSRNGARAYPGKGIRRDTDTSQAGGGGQLAKDGAVLRFTPETAAFLQHEPVSDTWRAMIPTPTESGFDLHLPDGLRLRTDGQVGLFEVIIQNQGRHVEIWHAFPPTGDSSNDEATRTLTIQGPSTPPAIIKNGRTIRASRESIDGQFVWQVLLGS